ncbi:MAG TPA: VapE domain-containing protein, partial [Lachnospiraceae bacterium]|nr:VapE domain-containing protein [Lachnospiraceae bacterium]
MKEYTQLQYALSYIKLGFAIFPLKPRSKIPLTKNGFKDASKDEKQIKKWWSENPNSNIGIATGSVSDNLFVIDFDIDEDKGLNGYHAFTDYCRENGVSFPDTVMVITGRGGYHWYYKSDKEVGSRTGIIEGVDLRGNGGYVVAPGSIHANGNKYEFEQDFNDIQIAMATKEVYEFINQKTHSDSEQFILPDTIPEGMRNATFYKLACSLQAKGLSDETIQDVVMKEAAARSQPSMGKDDLEELEKTIKSALNKEKGKLKIVPFYKPQPKQFVTLKTRETKSGSVVIQSIENVCTVLRMDENLAGKIKYNSISYSPWVYGDLPWSNGDNYREWTNCDDSNLKCYIEDNHGLNSMDKIMEGLNIVVGENYFNPVVDYLEQLQWDGTSRISNLLSDYLGVEKNEYSETAMRLFMIGAINRAYHPGCKFDYMPVLVGEQGVGKSTFFKILAGNDAWYNDNFNNIEGDKACEKLRGMWIVELAELLATKKAKEVESIKAFITSTIDSYRQPYGRRTEQRPRVCVFAGTTNNMHFMTDRTGNRRYLPLIVRKKYVKKSLFDKPEQVQEEFKQAWGEAMHIYKTDNPRLIFPRHLEDL